MCGGELPFRSQPSGQAGGPRMVAMDISQEGDTPSITLAVTMTVLKLAARGPIPNRKSRAYHQISIHAGKIESNEITVPLNISTCVCASSSSRSTEPATGAGRLQRPTRSGAPPYPRGYSQAEPESFIRGPLASCSRLQSGSGFSERPDRPCITVSAVS
jgi:hypothetical protein